MQVFICPGCNAQHDTEDIEDNYIDICDGCKLPFTKNANQFPCQTCSDNDNSYNYPEYHKTCVVKIDGVHYCNVHKVAKEKALEAGTVIQKYAHEFWNELGGTVVEFKQTAGSLNRKFKVQFEALNLEVKLSAVTKPNANDDTIREDIVTTDEIIALNHNVSGIKSHGTKMYRVGIHSHESALQEVAEAMVRSLRSKKSALTVEKNEADTRFKQRMDWAKANPAKSKYKQKKAIEEIESYHDEALSGVATQRRKINKMSKFLVGKLADFKKAREEKALKPQETVLV